METLAAKIKRHLQAGELSHYAAYEVELQRLWPLEQKDRETKIAQFAKKYGFRLSFYKPGRCATFEKEPPPREVLGNHR